MSEMALNKDQLFEQEILPHLDSLYNFAFKLTRDDDEAKDLVQETSLKAYRFFDSYQEGTNAKAWLYRILKNTFINDFRKKSKEPSKIDYEEIEAFYNTEEADKKATTDLRVESVEEMVSDDIARALNALEPVHRAVIVLCDIEGFSYEELAKILDIPLGTVRSRLHRARQLLKENLLKLKD